MLCREKRKRDGGRHRLITERAKTDEISALSLLSSYLRQKVSKEGKLLYPNFVRGLLFVACNLWLTASRYLAPFVAQYVKFRDMPEIKRKHYYAIREIP